jgi:hypothetical protein
MRRVHLRHDMADRRLAEIESLYRERFRHFKRVAVAIVGDQERAVEAVHDGFADAMTAASWRSAECESGADQRRGAIDLAAARMSSRCGDRNEK